MKRVTALFLTVCLILALCACGETQVQTTDVQSRNEVTEPSETPNTETKQEEPVQQQEETAQQEEPAPEQEAEAAEETPVEEEETRGFTVEDFEIEEIDKNGTLKFKIKVRNNTDEDAAGFSFAYQLLDENSDSLYDASFLTHDILAGQAKWIGTIRVNESDYQGAVEIQFVRGELLGEGNIQLKPDNVLEERVKFPLPFGDTEPAPKTERSKVTENEHFKLDNLCEDGSYQDSDGSTLRKLYLFYTLTATDENLEIDSKYTKLTINGTNTYESVLGTKEATKYMGSYTYTPYIQHVYMGESKKMVACFLIPEADLAPGRKIKISDSQIPGIEEISLDTAMKVLFDNPENLAKYADPEGYENYQYLMETPEPEMEAMIKNGLNGHYWKFTPMGLSVLMKLEFSAPDKFSMYNSLTKTTSSGTYVVKRGFVVVTYTDTGVSVEIPIEFEDNNEIDLDVCNAFGIS